MESLFRQTCFIVCLAATAISHAEPEKTVEVDLMGFGAGEIELPYEAAFSGSASCAQCHVGHAEMQASSSMFLTGREVTEENMDTWFSEEALQKPVRWPEGELSGTPHPPQYRRRSDGVYLEGVTREGETVMARVDAVFGSGLHAMTPMTGEPGRQSRELRVTYSHVYDSWIMTPGSFRHSDPIGYVRPPEETDNCFFCHTTRIAWDTAQDDDLLTSQSQFGVHCERCHGPGSAHIDAVVAGEEGQKILNPGKFRADKQVEFCGQCHRRSADVEPLAALQREVKISRHAGLSHMLSKCFRLSPPEEALSCLDCHNPHRNVDPDRDQYNTPCLRCHTAPETDHKSTAVIATSDCVSCHMPVQESAFEGMDFTDHWIRIPGTPAPFKSESKEEYAAYLEASYRDAIVRTTHGEERKTRYRMRLGELLFGMGREAEGLEWIGKALTFGPLHRDRLIAGELFERGGQQEKAIPILEAAIGNAPDNDRAYYTLTRLYLRQRKLAAAADVLARWDKAIPGDKLHAEMYAKWQRLDARDAASGPSGG